MRLKEFVDITYPSSDYITNVLDSGTIEVHSKEEFQFSPWVSEVTEFLQALESRYYLEWKCVFYTPYYFRLEKKNEI
jgi:hypothetical protein